MSKMLILTPDPVASVVASRGSGSANLLTDDPKEVWMDSAAGATVTLDLDLGTLRSIDTIFVGALYGAVAGSSWTITGGAGGPADTVLKSVGPLRAVDSAGHTPDLSHALWFGERTILRYIRLSLFQPQGVEPLAAGRVMVGLAFVPTWNQEWGAGRNVIDTSEVTPLPSGGFAIVEGACKGAYGWTLGDLSTAEVDQLYVIQKDRGVGKPVVVVEDAAATSGQLHRIHYGLFTGLKRYERRSVAQTRWEFTMEEWV